MTSFSPFFSILRLICLVMLIMDQSWKFSFFHFEAGSQSIRFALNSPSRIYYLSHWILELLLNVKCECKLLPLSMQAYPSLKPLASWVADLVDRMQFIQQWVDSGIPSVCVGISVTFPDIPDCYRNRPVGWNQLSLNLANMSRTDIVSFVSSNCQAANLDPKRIVHSVSPESRGIVQRSYIVVDPQMTWPRRGECEWLGGRVFLQLELERCAFP